MAVFRDWDPLVAADDVIRGPALVVAPHPDDEVIGVGGILVLHRRRGVDVHVAIMTDGRLGNPGGIGDDAYIARREAETRAALVRAGGAQSHFLRFPDGSLRDAATARTAVADLVRTLAPASIFFPSPFEIHPDHVATAAIVLDVVTGLAAPPALFAYEIGGMLVPNLLVDITSAMAAKEAAIEAYASQLAHQDIIAKVRALNRARTVNVADPAVLYVEALMEIAPGSIPAWVAAVDRVLELAAGRRRS